MTCSPRSLAGCRPPPGPHPAPRRRAGRWPRCTGRPRYEPRNLDFAGGLDRWDLDSWPGPGPDRPGPADGERDYAAAAEGLSAVLSSTVSRPAGSAALVQAIYADDYRGKAVTFSGEISGDLPAGQAGLRVEILRHWWRGAGTREDHGLTVVSRPPRLDRARDYGADPR